MITWADWRNTFLLFWITMSNNVIKIKIKYIKEKHTKAAMIAIWDTKGKGMSRRFTRPTQKKIGLNLKSVNQAGEVVKWTGKQTDTKAKPQWHNIRVLYSWGAKHSHGLYLVFCHNFSLRVKHKTLLKYLSPSIQAQSQTCAKRPVSFNQNGCQLQETTLLNFHQTKIILRGTKK